MRGQPLWDCIAPERSEKRGTQEKETGSGPWKDIPPVSVEQEILHKRNGEGGQLHWDGQEEPCCPWQVLTRPLDSVRRWPFVAVPHIGDGMEKPEVAQRAVTERTKGRKQDLREKTRMGAILQRDNLVRRLFN